MNATARPKSETFTANVSGDIFVVELTTDGEVIRCTRSLRYSSVPAYLLARDAVAAAKLQQNRRRPATARKGS